MSMGGVGEGTSMGEVGGGSKDRRGGEGGGMSMRKGGRGLEDERSSFVPTGVPLKTSVWGLGSDRREVVFF